MAGTDFTKRGVTGAGAGPENGAATGAPSPVIVLVEPQLGENIGAAARAMLNFGLREMRLVNPRDEWPNYKAITTASGAESVLEDARLFDSTAEAIADLGPMLATSSRARDMEKPTANPRQAAAWLRAAEARGERTGILFGRERTGLENDDVALAEQLIVVPANPGHASINLAQSVLLIGYEWFQAGEPDATLLGRKGARLAEKAELVDFFEHLEGALDEGGFLKPVEKRPRMVRNIRNLFSRACLTDQEVRTLRGIVSCLTNGRHGPR